MATLWTIGHGTREAAALVDLLRAAGIAWLVDVRTVPRSRRNPQFNRDTLATTLREAGIAYTHLPALGGLRKPRPDSVNLGWRNASFRGYADYMQTPEFAAGLQALLQRAEQAPTAIMCAETVPWRCHRSLVADVLAAAGHRVEHIVGPGRTYAHARSPLARVVDGRVTYPPPQAPR